MAWRFQHLLLGLHSKLALLHLLFNIGGQRLSCGPPSPDANVLLCPPTCLPVPAHLPAAAACACLPVQKRKEFEDQARRVGRWNPTIWVKYAQWEEQQKDFRRARSVWERSLEVDYR